MNKMLPNGRGSGQTKKFKAPELTPQVAEVLNTLASLPEPDPVPEVEVRNSTPPPTSPGQLLFTLGKPYNPKSERNIDTWMKIKQALDDGPKTLAQITQLVLDHKDFVGYMVRGSHIIVRANHPVEK